MKRVSAPPNGTVSRPTDEGVLSTPAVMSLPDVSVRMTKAWSKTLTMSKSDGIPTNLHEADHESDGPRNKLEFRLLRSKSVFFCLLSETARPCHTDEHSI